jgi:flagellar hook-associated protein 1 FlgK
MGLASVLGIATSGLGVTQSSLDIVARNVANADTPGYTKKSIGQENNLAGGFSFGVRDTTITRAVDQFLQSQLRTQTATMGNIEVRQDSLDRIDQLFGAPGGANSLDSIFNEFTQSLQDLAASPEMFSARAGVVGSAEVLAQQLREMSAQVQALRQLAEDSIEQAVNDVNDALTQLASINHSLSLEGASGALSADLQDERDKFIDQISQYLDIRVAAKPDGQVSLFMQNGNVLLEGQPVQLVFDHHSSINPSSVYSPVDADRGVGTIKLLSANGFEIDLIRSGILDSGRIGGLIELRDSTLVEAQAQLDELAHGLALSLSSRTEAGTAVTSGTQLGFDIDTTGLLAGNSITLNFTPTPPGTEREVTIVRVDDPAALPLTNDATANPNDLVIGVDFSGGMAAVAAALNTALDGGAILGDGITVSAPGGNVLRFLDDTGVGDTTVIGSVSATITSTALQDDGTQLPLFVDGPTTQIAYTGSLDFGNQKAGFASRIAVNQQVIQNDELLVRYATAPQTDIGDNTRPLELAERLMSTPFTFSSASGIGQVQNPFVGDIGSYMERMIAVQTGKAEAASREFASAEVVHTALQAKFTDSTAVDINEELSALIELQNVFAANARIIGVVDELFERLFEAT